MKFCLPWGSCRPRGARRGRGGGPRARAGAQLADAGHPRDRALGRGRNHRFPGARLGRVSVLAPRPAGDHREQHGRGRQCRHGERRARAPDGHTFGFISTNNLAINQFLFKSLPYDPIKDLTPVAVVAEAPQILVVAKSVPAQNLKEFIALLKAKPNSLNYASAGPGTTPHLAAVQFMRLADVQMTHVPYRGAAPAVTDLASGQVQVLSVGAAPVAGVMAAGDVRALAAATKTRMPVLPNLPTAAEAGLPGFESTTWFGLVAPAKTPQPIVDRLNALMREWVADPKNEGALRQGVSPADEHERGRVREVRRRGGDANGRRSSRTPA